MALTFNATGRVGQPADHVATWRERAAAAPTAEAFAETYLGHADDELEARVSNGRLVVSTKAAAKNVVGADGRPARLAYFELSIDLPTSVLADLAERLAARLRAYQGALE